MALVLELDPVFLTGSAVAVTVSTRRVEAPEARDVAGEVAVALATAEDSGPCSKVSEMKDESSWSKLTSLLLRYNNKGSLSHEKTTSGFGVTHRCQH